MATPINRTRHTGRTQATTNGNTNQPNTWHTGHTHKQSQMAHQMQYTCNKKWTRTGQELSNKQHQTNRTNKHGLNIMLNLSLAQKSPNRPCPPMLANGCQKLTMSPPHNPNWMAMPPISTMMANGKTQPNTENCPNCARSIRCKTNCARCPHHQQQTCA